MTKEQQEYKDSVMAPVGELHRIRLELLYLKIELKEVCERLRMLEERTN